MRVRLLASFGVFLVLSGTRVFAQANVNQNTTTWLYVDAVKGNDGNSGNSSAPFRTIQTAVDNADQTGGGVTIIVNPGVYRENVTIQNHASGNAQLTLQAAVTGTAVIAGSEIITGWKQQNATTYMTFWPYDLGSCSIPSGWYMKLCAHHDSKGSRDGQRGSSNPGDAFQRYAAGHLLYRRSISPAAYRTACGY